MDKLEELEISLNFALIKTDIGEDQIVLKKNWN